MNNNTIDIKINKILSDLGKLNKINRFRSLSIAQDIRRKTLKYIVNNKKFEDENINSNLDLFNKLSGLNIKNLFDFFRIDLSDYFEEKKKTKKWTLSSNPKNFTVIANDILNICETNEFQNFSLIIHGSQIDGKTSNYSDLDITIFLKNSYLNNIENFQNTLMKIEILNQRIAFWDNTGHHNCFLSLESDLSCYPESFMPINVLKKGALPSNHNINFKATRYDLDLLFDYFINILKNIIRLINQKKYINPFGLKQLVSNYFMLIIYEFQILYGKYYDKEEIFLNQIKNYFDKDDYEVFEKVSSIRNNWPSYNSLKTISVSENFIIDVMKHVKKISKNVQQDHILKKLIEKYIK